MAEIVRINIFVQVWLLENALEMSICVKTAFLLDVKFRVIPKGGLKSESRRMIFKLPKRVPKTILGLKKRKFSVFLHLQVESIFWFYK